MYYKFSSNTTLLLHYFPFRSSLSPKEGCQYTIPFYFVSKPVWIQQVPFHNVMTKRQISYYILYLLPPADEIRMFDHSVTSSPYSITGAFPCLFPYILKNTLAYRACSIYSGPSYISLVFLHLMLEILKGTECYNEVLL